MTRVLGLPGGEEVMVQERGHPTLREQEALLGDAPDVYSLAPYVGRFGWVKVDLSKVDPDELRELVVEAWRRTAPKKLVKEYDSA